MDVKLAKKKPPPPTKKKSLALLCASSPTVYLFFPRLIMPHGPTASLEIA